MSPPVTERIIETNGVRLRTGLEL
jgi:hypothetical protein